MNTSFRSLEDVIEQARKEGRILHDSGTAKLPQVAGPGAAKARGKRKPVLLLETRKVGPSSWEVGLETRSEANGTRWRGKHNRTHAAKLAIRKAIVLRDVVPFEERLLSCLPIHVKLTRIGGRELDRFENLPASLKGVVDAVAYLLGIDDSSPLFCVSCAQEPGGGAYGVRIELSKGEGG